MMYGRPYCKQMQTQQVTCTGWKLVWCMVEPTVCRCTQSKSPARVGNSFVVGRTYCMQMYTKRVTSKGWKLIWCTVGPTVCRCRHSESSARVGNSYGVWQNLLNEDVHKVSHQQGLETYMVYSRAYCMQM